MSITPTEISTNLPSFIDNPFVAFTLIESVSFIYRRLEASNTGPVANSRSTRAQLKSMLLKPN
jgi:hypothetical protein